MKYALQIIENGVARDGRLPAGWEAYTLVVASWLRVAIEAVEVVREMEKAAEGEKEDGKK